MIMLSVAVSTFNSLNELKRMIFSVQKHVKYIIVVDGKFKDFDYPSDLSTDGSREFLQSFDNVILIDAPNLREVEKRQVYLDKTKELDVDLLLVMDSDEFVECEDWNLFEKYCRFEYEVYNKQTNQFGILVENANIQGQFDSRPRIFAHPYDIKHNDNDHKNFTTKSNIPLDMSSVIVGLKLRHNYDLRTPSYQKLRLSYQKKLTASEH